MGDALSNPDAVVSRNLAPEGGLIGAELAESFEVAEAKEFWTAERMAEAMPVSNEVDELVEVEWPGASRFAEAAAVEKHESKWPAGTAEDPLAPSSIPGGYETVRVSDYLRAPYVAVGRLYMAFGEELKTATAWAVGERAILTAGHCLFDHETQAKWASHIKFVPRFRSGAEPAGAWIAVSIHTLAGWKDGKDHRYDLAGVVLNRPVRPATGTIGWIAGQPHAGPYQSVGYPAKYLSGAHNFDGKEMWRCNGIQAAAGQMANNMTKGSSGGPWLVRKDGKVYAVGLNSYRLSTGQTGKMNSPPFGEGFLKLIETIGG